MRASDRIKSIAMIFVMLASWFIWDIPVSTVKAVAAVTSVDVSEDGEPNTPVILGPNGNLMTWSAFLNQASSGSGGTYELQADITIPFNLTYTADKLRNKTFNGGDHIITLTKSSEGENAFKDSSSNYLYVGIFRIVENSTVSNLRIDVRDDIVLTHTINGNSTGQRVEAGIVAGVMSSSSIIRRVEITGDGSFTINATYNTFTERQASGRSTLDSLGTRLYNYEDSDVRYAWARSTSASEFVAMGGVVGHSFGSGANNQISECHMELDLKLNGLVKAGESPAGKLVETQILQRINTRFSLGGIVGIALSSYCNITNCYMGGSLESNVLIGRFFLIASDFHIFNYAAGILGSQMADSGAFNSVTGQCRINYCVSDASKISTSIKSENGNGVFNNWIRATRFLDSTVNTSMPSTGFFAYSSAIANYSYYDSYLLSGNYVTSACRGGLVSDCKENQTAGIYWNDMASSQGNQDGFSGQWYNNERNLNYLTNQDVPRYARGFTGNLSNTRVIRSTYAQATDSLLLWAIAEQYGSNYRYYYIDTQRYEIEDLSSSVSLVNFTSLTANELSAAWKDYKGGGVYLAWRTWIRSKGIEIAVGTSKDPSDRSVTIYLVDNTDPLNIIRTEATKDDGVEYEISYYKSGVPASVNSVNFSSPPLSVQRSIGYSVANVTEHTVTYEMALGADSLPSDTSVLNDKISLSFSDKNGESVAKDGSSTVTYDNNAKLINIKGVAKYSIGQSAPTMTVEIMPDALVTLGYNEGVTLNSATITTHPGDVKDKNADPQYNIVNYDRLNMADYGFTPTLSPPTGVIYYYQFANNKPEYSDPNWIKYSPPTNQSGAALPIVSQKAKTGGKLYMYAESEYSFNPSSSNITAFTIPSSTGTVSPPNADTPSNPAGGSTNVKTAWVLYEGIFNIKDDNILGKISVDTEMPLIITARLTDDTQVRGSIEFMLGRTLPTPVITPNGTGEVFGPDTKVEIRCPGVDVNSYFILYRLSNSIADSNPNAGWNITEERLLDSGNNYVTTWPDGAIKYDAASGIEFPPNDNYFTVWAIAIPKDPKDLATDQIKMSSVAKISYTSTNKQTPAAPTMKTNPGGDFDRSRNIYYDGPGTMFSFDHNDLSTRPADTSTPAAYLQIKVDGRQLENYYKGEQINLYQYALASNPSIQVEARLIRTGYPQSYPFNETINFVRALNEVTYELHGPNEGQTLPVNQLYENGSAISFILNTLDIPEAYRAGNNGSVTVSSDIIYDSAMPRIVYDITYVGANDTPPQLAPLTIANGTLYTPASPRLVNSNGTEIRAARTAQKITFDQLAPETKIIVRAIVLPAADSGDMNAATASRYSTSTTRTINLTVRSQLEPPGVYPQDTIAPNSEVELASNNAGKTTQVYYTLESGVPPQMEWNPLTKRYEPLVVLDSDGKVDEKLSTYRFKLGDIISPPSGTFNIQAMVVSETGQYAPSNARIFRFAINSLPQANAVESFPLTGSSVPTTLAIGATITLRTETVGTDIYYTLDNSAPIPGQTGTYLYDPANGITMQPRTGERQFIITAIARDQLGKTWSDSKVVQFVYEIQKTAAPQASPVATTPTGGVTVLEPGTTITLTCATPNSTIYYTTDNTLPVPGASGTYRYTTGGIAMPNDGKAFFTIWAVALVEGSGATTVQSDSVSFTYQPPAQVHGVYALPADGTVVKGTEVRLFSSTQNADIFYEIAYGNEYPDDPVAYSSQPYSPDKPIIINKNTTIAAIAAKDGMVSRIAEYYYEVASQVRTPNPSIAGGSVVAKGTKLTFYTTGGATVIYTKDGSDPTKADNKNRMFGSSIVLDAEEGKSVSISAYAVKDGMSDSELVSFSYSISKQADILIVSPAPGSVVELGSQIILASSLSDGSIHYTLDGSDPDSSSPTSGSITVTGAPGGTFLIKACVITEGSATTTQIFSYTIMAKTPAPSSSIPNGAYVMEGAKAKLTVSEGNIHYTTDGTTPTSSSQLYSDPITVDRSMVLKAIAIADNKAPSDIAEFIYTRAGQVAAPTSSISSGQVEPGTQIILFTSTEDATIYYSTNGVDPDPAKTGNLFVYDSPITISRAVTIKMIAVKSLMHPSVVNTVNYTVTRPVVSEEEEGEEDLGYSYDPNRLINRHDFSNQPLGPKYAQDGILLRSASFGGLLSAPAEVFPRQAVLDIQQIVPTASESRAVRDELNFGILDLYDVKVTVNGEYVQPQVPVEIGLPIPDKYSNAVVVICHFDDNGSLTVYPTRRAQNMAYAEISGFSKYALAATIIDDGKNGLSVPVAIVIVAACVLATAILAFTLRRKKTRN